MLIRDDASTPHDVRVDHGRVINVGAQDNLAKGASRQAVQCASLMLNLREAAGLV